MDDEVKIPDPFKTSSTARNGRIRTVGAWTWTWTWTWTWVYSYST